MSKMSKTGLLILNFVPLAAVASAIITPALPNIKQYYGVSLGQLEWVVSIFLIGYMLGQIIYGPWANVVGRINSLRVGIAIGMIGIATCYYAYFSGQFWVLLLGRFINAIGSASGLVCAFILINEELDEHEAKKTFAYTPISFALSVTLAIYVGGVISHYLGWHNTFIFLFAHHLIMFLLLPLVPSQFSREAYLKTMSQKQHIKIDSQNIIKLLCFSFILGSATAITYCYTTAAPLIAKIHFNFNPNQYGTWNLINFFGVVVAGLTLAAALKKLGGMKVISRAIGVLLIVILSYLVVLLTHKDAPLWFFITSCIMYFGTSWSFSAASFYGSQAIANRALGSSILSFTNMLCAVVGVIVLGYLTFDQLLDLVLISGAFWLVMVVCLIWLIRKNAFQLPKVD